jgi:hypothetical protein
VNPKTKKLVVSKHEIKKISLEYCKETLKNNEPEDDFKEGIEKKIELANKKLREENEEFVIQRETYEKVIAKFKSSNKRNYDFIVRASESFQTAVFNLCQNMIAEEKFPESFRETTLHMIYKGKGRREVLSDNRFIHSKTWLPRTVEGCVVEQGMKGPLVEGSSIYQIGGQPGHRAEELMFVMKSIVAQKRAEGKAIIIQCWDLSKYFDKEMMEDALLTCYKRNINTKAVRLWYKLNQNTRIRVKTGVGMSGYAEVGAVVGQGTIGGAVVSQAVLDEAVSEEFHPGGENEVSYGLVPMQPCMFQDDLIHVALGIKEAREASRKINIAVKKRGLRLNEDKSVYIVLGTKKQKEKINEELMSKPRMCGDVSMNLKEKDKWLGQPLSAGGRAASVAATVAAREVKIRGAGLEFANFEHDWRSQAAGGMETALVLWEACCIPSLLHGAGTWVQITSATERKLNALQQWFLRLVLQVGPGAPLAALGWETGVLDMKLRVWREKICLLLHIRSLGEETLASQVYREQVARQWPGLAREVSAICAELNLEDCNSTNLTKEDYKYLAEIALKNKNEEMLRNQGAGKKKLEKILREEPGKKEYISQKLISDVRQWFRTRAGLLPFAGNYSKDQRFAKTEWMCRCESVKEDEPHIVSGDCPVYNDIHEKYDNLEDDSELVEFFREVLERRDLVDRMEEDEEEEEEDEKEEEEEALAVGDTADVLPASDLEASQSSNTH